MSSKFSKPEQMRIVREIAGRCAAMTGKWITMDVCGDAGLFVGSHAIRGFREAGLVRKYEKRNRAGSYIYETVDAAGLLAILNGAPVPIAKQKGGIQSEDLGKHYDASALIEAFNYQVKRLDGERHPHGVAHNKTASTRPVDLPQSGTLMEISV